MKWSKKRTERTASMRQFAYELGMQFDAKPAFTDLKMLKAFELFKHGTSQKITNHCSVTDDYLEYKHQLFDFEYTVQAGNSTAQFNQTVLFILGQRLELPIFRLRPETWLDRIGRYFGWEDIDFEHHPEFSHQYFLRGEDEILVRHLFDERTLHYFTLHDGWHLEGIGFFMILYKKSKLLTIPEVKQLYQVGMELFNIFKEYKVLS